MITVILFSVWKNMGYYMVIYLAGLQGCNPDLNEAAELDGANPVSYTHLLPSLYTVMLPVSLWLWLSPLEPNFAPSTQLPCRAA